MTVSALVRQAAGPALVIGVVGVAACDDGAAVGELVGLSEVVVGVEAGADEVESEEVAVVTELVDPVGAAALVHPVSAMIAIAIVPNTAVAGRRRSTGGKTPGRWTSLRWSGDEGCTVKT